MATFTPDSSLVTSVVPSPTGEWYSRSGFAIVGAAIHMAEGGGTDTHLTRLDGNSSHYVVKYTGRLVQMVPESYAAGSMNPRLTRTTDGPLYGISVLRAVMGSISPTYVNRVFIAIEIEGYASAGPNAAQRSTLGNLIRDLSSRHARTWRGLIGHADQQSYKPCPGSLIPWSSLGGHGLWLPQTSTEDNLRITKRVRELWHPTVTNGRSNGVLRYLPDRREPFFTRLPADRSIITIAEVTGDDGSNLRLVEYPGTLPVYAVRSDWISDGFLPDEGAGVDQATYDALQVAYTNLRAQAEADVIAERNRVVQVMTTGSRIVFPEV